jgi:AcrR family transcriptional regulator
MTSGAVRKDAERNRARIVEAAREVFAEKGVYAPVREIALVAGVGVGTLYRRFPDRTALVEAVFIDRGLEYLSALERAAAAEDPWLGFRDYLERLFEIQRNSRGVTDLLTVALPRSPRMEEIRAQIYDTQYEVIERAKTAGLRTDFVPEDVILMLIAHAAIIQAVGEHDSRSSPRFAEMVLQAIAVEAERPLPPPTSSPDLAEALQRPAVISRTRRPRGKKKRQP